MKTLTLLLCALIIAGCSHSSPSVSAPTPESPVLSQPTSASEPRKTVPVVPEEDMQTITGEGFTFQVPKDFIRDDSKGATVYVSSDKLVEIAVEGYNTEKNLTDYVAGLEQALQDAGMTLMDDRAAMFAGHHGRAIVLSKGMAFIASFITVHNKHAYQFICGLPIFAVKEKSPICVESGMSVRLTDTK
jgi:hypothetical protein